MERNCVCIIEDVKKARIVETPLPDIKKSEVLLANKVCALCTSDYQLWMGKRDNVPYNVAFGHENAGIVVKTGSEVKHIKPGDRVAVGVLGCGVCEDCKKGLNLKRCSHVVSAHITGNADGYHGPHGASAYKAVEERKLFKVRDGVPLSHAALLEPVATVVEGMERLRVKPGENVLVAGAGTMGNLNAQVARKYGATVLVSEISSKKRETLRKMGFDKVIDPSREDIKERVAGLLDGRALDAIVVSVGATSVYRQIFEIAPKCCRILLFAANYPEPDWGMALTPNLVHYNLWEIIGTFTASTAAFQKAMDFINAKELCLEMLIDGEYPVAQVQKAFEAAAKPDQYRIILNI